VTSLPTALSPAYAIPPSHSYRLCLQRMSGDT